MQFVSYSYDIPKATPIKDYPNPGPRLRKFAVRVQQSVWYMYESMIPYTLELTDDIRRLGGVVDVFRFDTCEREVILHKAKVCLAQEIDRIRSYVETSIVSTTERLEEAKKLTSAGNTNAAIRYQQAALAKALVDLGDAEECAVAFDLSGDAAELIQSLRSAIKARTAAFMTIKEESRGAVKTAGREEPKAPNVEPAVPVATVATEPAVDTESAAVIPLESSDPVPEADDADPAALGFGFVDDPVPDTGSGG